MGSFYLHYWYADYQEKTGRAPSVYTMKNLVKEHLGALQVEATKRRLSMNVSGGGGGSEADLLSGFGKIITFLEDSDAGKTRKEIFDQNTIQSETPFGMFNSEMSKRDYTVADIIEDAEKMAEIIDAFQGQLDNFIEQAAKKIGIQDLENYKDIIIEEYAAKRNVNAEKNPSAFRERVLKDFLKHEGLVSLNLSATGGGDSAKSQASLQSSLRNLVLLAEALPGYGKEGSQQLGARKYSTGHSGKHQTANSEETLIVILRKCTGLFNNIVGKGGELAAKVAEEGLKNQLVEYLQKVNKNISSQNVTVVSNVVGDGSVSDSKTIKVNKADIWTTITIPGKGGKGQVVVEYGTSVKTTRFNDSSNVANVSLVSGTPFWNVLQKYTMDGKDYGYLYNLAGGHSGKGLNSTQSISDSLLNSAWNSFLDKITVMNFLDFIAGEVGAHKTAWFFNMNGITKSIDEILLDLVADPDMLKTTLNAADNKRKLSRRALLLSNKWIDENNKKAAKSRRDSSLAFQRSDDATSEIVEALKSAKLNISLSYDLQLFFKSKY